MALSQYLQLRWHLILAARGQREALVENMGDARLRQYHVMIRIPFMSRRVL